MALPENQKTGFCSSITTYDKSVCQLTAYRCQLTAPNPNPNPKDEERERETVELNREVNRELNRELNREVNREVNQNPTTVDKQNPTPSSSSSPSGNKERERELPQATVA